MEKQLRIFIVEDNKHFAEAIANFLTDYKSISIIDILHDGIELLEHPKVGLAQLIITDIEMPLVGGLELAKQMNFMYPHIKLIGITMHEDRFLLEQLISVGFHGFVNKPDIAQLLIPSIIKVCNNNFSFPIRNN